MVADLDDAAYSLPRSHAGAWEREMDATLIEVPNSTKNKAGECDPEMHQTKKGNQWHFGMKAPIGVDARTGLTPSLTTTATNEHDLNQAENLLHGDKEFIFTDAGYRGAEKRDELKDIRGRLAYRGTSRKSKGLEETPNNQQGCDHYRIHESQCTSQC